MKRPIIFFAFAGILGIVFSNDRVDANSLMFLLAIVVLFLFAIYKKQIANNKMILIFLLIFAVFFVRSKLIQNQFKLYDLKISKFEDMNVKIEGTLLSEGDSENSHYYVLKNTTISTAYGNYDELSDANKEKYAYRYNQKIGKVKIYAKRIDSDVDFSPIPNIPEVYAGMKLSFLCSTMEQSYPTNKGEFDFKTYNRSQGISATFYTDKGIAILDKNVNYIYKFISDIKNKINNQINLVFNSEDAGIVSSILTGDKSNLSSKINKLFRDCGIAHILAISGLHLSILGLGLFELLRKRFSVNTSAVITTIFIILYGILIDASATSIRAIFMLLLRFISLSIGKIYDSNSALGFVLMLLMIYNPFILYNAGVQFSFIAIYSLNLIDSKKFKNKYMKILISSLVLQLFLLPITIYHYFQYPLYTMLLNFLVIPLMFYVLLISILSISTSFICFPIGYFLSGSVHYILLFYKILANFELTLPFSKITFGRPSVYQIIIYYFILMFIIHKEIFVPNNDNKTFKSMKIKKVKTIYTYLLVALVVFMNLLLLAYKKKYNLQVNYLNIGQGDSIVVKNKNLTMTIDGGSSSNKSNGKYILGPFILQDGADIIDMAFITHIDSDHTNGIMHLLSEDSDIKIKKLIMPLVAKNDNRYDKLRTLATENDTEVLYFKVGHRVTFDNSKEFVCLYPNNASHIEDPNAHSLVLLLKSNSNDKFLFMGDAGIDEESIVCRNATALNENLEGSILKAGHHGSSTSSSEYFIDFVRPKEVILSYGKNNQYGHPHREVVSLLRKKKLQTYSTAESGQITFEK